MTTTSRAYSPPTHLYVGRTEDEVIEELQILLDNEEKSSRRKQPRIQQFNQKLRTMPPVPMLACLRRPSLTCSAVTTLSAPRCLRTPPPIWGEGRPASRHPRYSCTVRTAWHHRPPKLADNCLLSRLRFSRLRPAATRA
mmetsp:Transcript_11552/g.27271  ORF Transcript_11552/g.27271 Transcript_11552/m.27271 type:complete len:139 (+) Transcript_11552:392-808(+)